MVKQKLLWIIWDAASKDVVDLLIKENKLPNLKFIEESGISRRVKLQKYNSQTPNALAIQFTGMDTETLNIGGFFTPIFVNEKITTQYYNTFLNNTVGQKTLWMSLLKKKKKIILSNIPFTNNKKISKTNDFVYNYNGYEHKVCKELVVKSENYTLKLCTFNNTEAMLIDTQYLNRKAKIYFYKIDTKECCSIYIENSLTDHLSLTIGKVYPMNDHCFWIDENIGLRVYALKRDDLNYTVLFTAAYSLEYLKENKEICFEDIKDKIGPFFGESYGRIFRKGLFGKLRVDGGNGNAEKFYLEISVQLAEYFNECNYYLINNLCYDFMIAYQPCIDEVGHEFFGHWKQAYELGNQYEQEFYWKMLTKIYQVADKLIEKINVFNNNINIIITSDHGMSSVSRIFYINEYLKRLGYLKIKEDNLIDIENSILFYHPCNNGALFVKESGKEIFEKKIKIKIMNLVDNYTKQKPIYKVTKMKKQSIYGDYYLETTEGYVLNSDFSDIVFNDTNKSGIHISRQDISSMDAIYYASGSIINKTKTEDKVISNIKIRSEIEKCLIQI